MKKLTLCLLLALVLLLSACRVGRCPVWNVNCYDDGMVSTIAP